MDKAIDNQAEGPDTLKPDSSQEVKEVKGDTAENQFDFLPHIIIDNEQY